MISRKFSVGCGYAVTRSDRILQRVEPRSFAFDKGYALPERMRHDQNIGKQDRGVETEAADRLQRNLGRPFGIVPMFCKLPLSH
jgi:hypothetical protein